MQYLYKSHFFFTEFRTREEKRGGINSHIPGPWPRRWRVGNVESFGFCPSLGHSEWRKFSWRRCSESQLEMCSVLRIGYFCFVWDLPRAGIPCIMYWVPRSSHPVPHRIQQTDLASLSSLATNFIPRSPAHWDTNTLQYQYICTPVRVEAEYQFTYFISPPFPRVAGSCGLNSF